MYALVVVVVVIVLIVRVVVIGVVVFCKKRLSLPKDFFNTNCKEIIKNEKKTLSFNVGIAANNKCTCKLMYVCKYLCYNS